MGTQGNDLTAGDLTAVETAAVGLLITGPGCVISKFALFRPADHLGEVRPVVLGAGARIGAFAVVHGGTELGEQARVEDRVIVGQPELGYAVREQHPGRDAIDGAATAGQLG